MWQVTWRIPMPSETGANGAFCKAGELTRTALEYAVVNYVNREINPKLFAGSRADLLDGWKGLIAIRNPLHGTVVPPIRWEPYGLSSR